MKHQLESDPIIRDYLSWLLKSRGLAIEIREKSDEKIDHIQKSMDDVKRRELEQIQKLLVDLINELFDRIEKMNPTKEESKVEKMNPTKEESKVEKMNPTKEESKIEEMSTSKKTSKIEFTDISWYKKLLDANEEKELTREQKNLDNSPK